MMNLVCLATNNMITLLISEYDEYNFGVNPSATLEDLQNEKYQFNEEEIDILKNYGNETLEKVIEFGKVEVTNDKN